MHKNNNKKKFQDLMLLNFYKRPPQYDLYMSKLFNSVVLLGVVVHYIIAIWIYGNKNLLYNVIKI